MGEFLKQYGGIVIAFAVGSCLMFLVAFAQDTSIASYNGVMADSVLNQSYEDINKVIKASAPEISVHENLTVGVGDEFKLADIVESAYGSRNITDAFFNIIQGKNLNISDIKNQLVPGKINVIYHEDFSSDKPGRYTVDLYVKNSTKDGLWDMKTCHIFVEDYM